MNKIYAAKAKKSFQIIAQRPGTKMSKKYPRPDFLPDAITQQAYTKWLLRKAAAHRKRDKERGNLTATIEAYKVAIHKAVIESAGHDEYTGEALSWPLISQYNNDESKKLKREYKAKFALLPSVDHVGDGLGQADFKICAWRTNDAKNDLSHKDFLDLCHKVISHSKKKL